MTSRPATCPGCGAPFRPGACAYCGRTNEPVRVALPEFGLIVMDVEQDTARVVRLNRPRPSVRW